MLYLRNDEAHDIGHQWYLEKIWDQNGVSEWTPKSDVKM